MAGVVDFEGREEVEAASSDNGTTHLSWSKERSEIIELEQSAEETFEDPVLRYRGADSGSVITGLAEGVHYFRVRGVSSGDWSEPLAVRVEFIDESKLWLILGLGGVVVVATIGAIVFGHMKSTHRVSE